jgi:hypothetical protein
MRIAELARLSLTASHSLISYGPAAPLTGRGFAAHLNLVALLRGLIARKCAFSLDPCECFSLPICTMH